MAKKQVKLTVSNEVFGMLVNGLVHENTISEYVSRLVREDVAEPYSTDERTKKELFMQAKELDTAIQKVKINYPEVDVRELEVVMDGYDRINKFLRKK